MNCPQFKANFNYNGQFRKVSNIFHLFYDVQYGNSYKGWSKTIIQLRKQENSFYLKVTKLEIKIFYKPTS